MQFSIVQDPFMYIPAPDVYQPLVVAVLDEIVHPVNVGFSLEEQYTPAPLEVSSPSVTLLVIVQLVKVGLLGPEIYTPPPPPDTHHVYINIAIGNSQTINDSCRSFATITHDPLP